MQPVTNLRVLMAATLTVCLAGPACGFNLNKSITVGEGTQSDGHSTVNGSITIGRSALVTGSVETVNGAISIGDDASVENAETVNGSVRVGRGVTARRIGSVNGSIRIDDDTTIEDSVSVVNGKIETGANTRIGGDVSNVNGEMLIEGSDIGGDLSTVNGDVTLSDSAILRGDLVVEKPSGWSWGKDRRKPRIVIGPGSRVDGDVVLEREVELFISESASVGGVRGEMSMDDAVRFSGSRP